MIQKFVDRFIEGKETLAEKWCTEAPNNYETMLADIITIIQSPEEYPWADNPDSKRIHTIDDGDYQGTLLFVIGAEGNQPGTYWYTQVDYGSCSGCDALEGARGYGDTSNINELMSIALNIVQSIRLMYDTEAR